jgi:FrmR/RcnR family transcriptional regulator, repressor of frmRAB operon
MTLVAATNQQSDSPMAHLIRDKHKLMNRVNRLQGQIEAVKRALDQEAECGTIMQLIAAARGALNGLMAEVVEGHLRNHMVDPDRSPTSAETQAAEEVIDVVRVYLK